MLAVVDCGKFEGLFSVLYEVIGVDSLRSAYDTAVKDLNCVLVHMPVEELVSQGGDILFSVGGTVCFIVMFRYGKYYLGQVLFDGGTWCTTGKWLFSENVYKYVLSRL